MKKIAFFALMLSLSVFAFGCTETHTDAPTDGAAPAPMENGTTEPAPATDAAPAEAPAEETPAE